MGSMSVVPLTDGVMGATVRLCAASLIRGAAAVDASMLRLPDRQAEPAVESSLRLYLTEADRAGWVVIDEATSRVRAFAGATTIELTPDDWRYTWMPPCSVQVAATACHAESDTAAAECYPLLLQQIKRLAQRQDITRVTTQARPGDTTAAQTWLRLGVRPGWPRGRSRHGSRQPRRPRASPYGRPSMGFSPYCEILAQSW